MSDTIAALKAEIEAAENRKKRISNWPESQYKKKKLICTECYIRGLQTAVRLLEQEQAQELPY